MLAFWYILELTGARPPQWLYLYLYLHLQYLSWKVVVGLRPNRDLSSHRNCFLEDPALDCQQDLEQWITGQPDLEIQNCCLHLKLVHNLMFWPVAANNEELPATVGTEKLCRDNQQQPTVQRTNCATPVQPTVKLCRETSETVRDSRDNPATSQHTN